MAQAGIGEGQGCGRCRPGFNLKVRSRHLPGVTEEKPWKNLSQDGRPLGLNPRPPECYAYALPLSYGGSVFGVRVLSLSYS